MGTNYYVMKNYCDCCGRGDKIHIGKKSYGWQFHFHAEYTKLDIPMLSKKMWMDFLENEIIIDEYGDHILIDDFKKIVEESLARPDNRNHYDYCSRDPEYKPCKK